MNMDSVSLFMLKCLKRPPTFQNNLKKKSFSQLEGCVANR